MKRLDLGVAVAIGLAAITVALQFAVVDDSIVDWQVRRHDAVMEGATGSPWAYRLLTEVPLSGLLAVLSPASALLVLRIVQNVAIFVIANAYLRRWGFGVGQAIAGLLLLGFAMTQANYRADLALNTYTDVLAFLLAGWFVLTGRSRWLVPLAVVAVASRETALLLPLVALARPSRHTLKVAAAGLVAGVLTYAAIRGLVGSRPPTPGAVGHVAGWNMVVYNFRLTSLLELSHLLTLTPLAALWWRRWPVPLRRLFWLVVPLWVAAHIAGSVVIETRLFLVPLSLVLIPGFLSRWLPPSAARELEAPEHDARELSEPSWRRLPVVAPAAR